MLNEIKIAWKSAFGKNEFRKTFFSSVILLVVVLSLLSRFLNLNEKRAGISFTDPYFGNIPPIDLTWVIFGLIYIGLFAGIILLLKHPENLLLAIQTYSVMVIFRIIAMYSLPLSPPADMIPLVDPFVQLFGSGEVLKKDLFFSGHTATMTLLFLTAPSPKAKKIFFIGIILVGAAVLLQHVHYSVDVIVAPFVAYSSYRLVIFINNNSGLEINK